jgi:hypothetical protein
MSDTDIINTAVQDWQQGHPISNGQARVIAAAWHGGQWSALYSFSSTGAVLENESDPHGRDIVAELSREIDALTDAPEREELEALLAYVENVGRRGSQNGWDRLWG